MALNNTKRRIKAPVPAMTNDDPQHGNRNFSPHEITVGNQFWALKTHLFIGFKGRPLVLKDLYMKFLVSCSFRLLRTPVRHNRTCVITWPEIFHHIAHAFESIVAVYIRWFYWYRHSRCPTSIPQTYQAYHVQPESNKKSLFIIWSSFFGKISHHFRQLADSVGKFITVVFIGTSLVSFKGARNQEAKMSYMCF